MQNPKSIGIVLFPGFSNLNLANAVEPLRAANDLSGRRLYAWRYLGLTDAPIRSSSGLPVTPDGVLSDARGDVLIACPSYGHEALCTPHCLRSLRAAAARFPVMAGLDTGAWLLAAAGLMDGHAVTCHWDVLDQLAETFPQVQVSDARFVVDGARISSGGATTTLELMLHLIEVDHGADLAQEVASLFMHGEGRAQLPPLAHPRMQAAAALMRRHLENPLPVPELARRLGLSQRSIEQAFRAAGQTTPAKLYQSIRLREARRLVRGTPLSVAEIATRTGYSDPTAMTRAFKAAFDTTPRAMRQTEFSRKV